VKIGYLCFLTDDSTRAARTAALVCAGCERFFVDEVNLLTEARPQLAAALNGLAGGDTLVIWSLGQLGTGSRELIYLISRLARQNASLLAIKEDVDTARDPAVANFCTAWFQLSRQALQPKIERGIRNATAAGKRIGRPEVLTFAQKLEINALRSKEVSTRDIAERMKITRSTLLRYLKNIRET
jgi:DNA invertase Pin-like site-specific DNA recombinase